MKRVKRNNIVYTKSNEKKFIYPKRSGGQKSHENDSFYRYLELYNITCIYNFFYMIILIPLIVRKGSYGGNVCERDH